MSCYTAVEGVKEVMDILSFVNSNAIRDHLKNINYQFNSLEAAWLIYNCHRLSYEEKKEAWLQLIREMPDCAVPKRPNCKGWPSLHEFLKDYIRVTDNEIRDFYKEEPPRDLRIHVFLLLQGGYFLDRGI